MAITLESAQNANAADNTNITITKPVDLAVGDLMVAHICTYDNDNVPLTMDILSGWTAIVDNQGVVVGVVNMNYRAFYKIADAADAAAENFTFTSSGGTADLISGAIMRITGYAPGTPLATAATGSQNNSATPSIAGAAVTPTIANSLILQMWCANTGGAGPFGTYAIATSNPSWTEAYDGLNDSVLGYACGYAVRPEITATGAVSCANGGDATTESGVITAVISPIYGITITGVAGALSFAGGTQIIKYGVKVIGVAGVLALAGGTQIITRALNWLNSSSKNAISPTNASKTAISPTNASKTASTFTNKTKSL